MASRRLRIKPIANVPVRRGKVNTENERSDSTTDADASKLTSIEPIVEISSQPEEFSIDLNNSEIKQNTLRNEVVSTVNLLASDVDNTNYSSSSNSDIAFTIEKDCSLVAIKKEFDSLSDCSKNAASNTITPPSKKVVPPGLVRNRVKPTVSISAVSRRPRELSKISNEGKASDSSLSQIDNGKELDERSKSISEKPCIVSNKDIGAGIPGITQIIPTGTAIRPQHDIIEPSTPVVGKGEAPQSMCEPDLPSEGAGSGDNINEQRSRFIKPRPHVVGGIQVIHKSGDANESQNYFSSDPVLPSNTSELISEHRLLESKQGGGTSASESDDESRRSLSEASTITPPVRKSTEISRPRFVKPTPRFIEASARRNSIQSSASESEDESRRSVSLASTVTPPNKRLGDLKGDELAEQNGKEECVDLPEKKPARTRRTQSSCTMRLAKARMDFQNKFGNRTPDRSRLTMFDLIFYNPTTNPMKSPEQENIKPMKTTKLDDDEKEEKILEERLAEEKVDEPSAPDDIEKDRNDAQEEEEDIAMPVPQVKVGPDGQIILDEKSLVIETTGAKKSREDLANSAVIVDYGNGSTGYGTYSNKHRKSKEWSKEETLKFYRALNRVGTDFSLMQSIFPKRTRQDLKIKYKKEDRLNRYLVEKALLYPLDFDLTDLEKELEKEEQEAKEKAAQKLKKSVSKKKNKLNYNIQHGSFLMRSMNAVDTGSKKKHTNKKRKCEPLDNCKNAKRFRAIKGKQDIESGLSSDEENELNYNYETDLTFNAGPDDDSRAEHDTSDYETAELEYLTRPPKPTRSGRVPQPRKLVEIEDSVKGRSSTKKESSASGLKLSLKNTESQPMPLEDLTNMEAKTASKSSENQVSQPTTPENHAIPLENLTDIEPGSLVVLATQSPTHPGHQVYKVFMVTPHAPVNVPLSMALPDSFVHKDSDSYNEPSEQIGNVPEFMSLQQDEPLPGELAELLPVKQSESIPSQIGGFVPVHDAEPLTSQLVQFLPVHQALQAECSSDELTQLLSDQSEAAPCAVFSSQQEVTDEHNNPLAVQQIQLQSDQPVQLEYLIENGT